MQGFLLSYIPLIFLIALIIGYCSVGYSIDKSAKQCDKNCKKYRLGITRFLFIYYQHKSREVTKEALIFLIVGYSLNLICLAMIILLVTVLRNVVMFWTLVAYWIACFILLAVISVYFSIKYEI